MCFVFQNDEYTCRYLLQCRKEMSRIVCVYDTRSKEIERSIWVNLSITIFFNRFGRRITHGAFIVITGVVLLSILAVYEGKALTIYFIGSLLCIIYDP